MKLTVDTRELKAALHRLAAVPGARAIRAVSLRADSFGGLLLQQNTNLACMKVECPATVAEDGAAIVGLKPFTNLLARWSAPLMEIEGGERKVSCKGGSSTGELALLLPSEIEPELPEPAGMPLVFDSLDLKQWLGVAALGAYNEGGRDNLRGVSIRTCLGRITIVGADGRRLHACFGEEAFDMVLEGEDEHGKPTGQDVGVLISKEMIAAIDRMIGDEQCAARLRVGPRGAQLEAAGRVLRFLVSHTGPPDLSLFIAEAPQHITCRTDREKLLAIVKAATLLGAGDHQLITMHYLEGRVRVEADDGQHNLYTDELPGTPSKFPVAFRVNGGYLTDFLASGTTAEIEIGFERNYYALTQREPDRYAMLSLVRDPSIPDHLLP